MKLARVELLARRRFLSNFNCMEPLANQSDLLRLFEGVLLASPSGNICYAKVVKGRLLIPYSRSEQSELAGHYFNCQIFGRKLVCRFERLILILPVFYFFSWDRIAPCKAVGV
jgi:hypothetical protein